MTDPAEHPAALDPKAFALQCATRFTRRSGPGGQNRNKVETAVIVVHRPTGLGAEAAERRSQAENLKTALFRLRVNLAIQVRRPFRDAPSLLWISRCRGGRIVVSPSHDDFPALLAEAIDALDASTYDVKTAASALGCSASQLIKFLKSEPRAFQVVNERRKALELHPLV
jgi:RF-1 domain